MMLSKTPAISIIKRFAVLAVFALASCGAPGTPKQVPSDSFAAKRLPSCVVIEANQPAPQFRTDFYLTTWFSATREVSAIGIREGLSGDDPVSRYLGSFQSSPSRIGSFDLVQSSNESQAFCTILPTAERAAQAALASSFASLKNHGYHVRGPVGEAGRLSTSFTRHSHGAAAWFDRYISFTVPLSGRETAIVVRRDVFISRQNSPYIEATSVGQNESALLLRARDTLR